MSSTALMWAATVAPVADVQEYAILVRMADEADEAGCGVFLATSTIAEDVKVSEKTAQRRLDAMLDRKLIGLGDERLAARIRPDRRPVVYDLLIPAVCFADLAKTNARRAAKGLPPLTPETRPIQAPPSDEDRRARRSDVGKPRPRKLVDNPDGGREPDSQSGQDGVTDSPPATGGLPVTPIPTGGLPVRDGVTDSPARGDYQSPDPGVDPGDDPGTPPPIRTSVTTTPAGEQTATGGSDLDDETRAMLNTAADAAAAVRAAGAPGGADGWQPAQIRGAVRAALDAGHAPALVAERLAVIAADPVGTAFPTRLRKMLDAEAAAAATAAARKANQAGAGTPPPWAEGPFRYLDNDRPRCPKHPGHPGDNCGQCVMDARIAAAEAADAAEDDAAPAVAPPVGGKAARAAARAAAAAAKGTSRTREDRRKPPHVPRQAAPADPTPAPAEAPEPVGAAA